MREILLTVTTIGLATLVACDRLHPTDSNGNNDGVPPVVIVNETDAPANTARTGATDALLDFMRAEESRLSASVRDAAYTGHTNSAEVKVLDSLSACIGVYEIALAEGVQSRRITSAQCFQASQDFMYVGVLAQEASRDELVASSNVAANMFFDEYERRFRSE